MPPKALYIHIPFCKNICSYCNFCKLFYKKEWEKDYIETLKFEIDQYKINYPLNTIYIGGGTPTALSDECFEDFLSYLSQFTCKKEFTCEANIESLTEKKLVLMQKHGVNRLSIGVQTTKNSALKFMERDYDFNTAKSRILLAKKYIKNVNLDLIYAYPGETKEDLISDIDKFIALKPNHISTYSLQIEPQSKLYIKGYRELDDEIQRSFYDLILENLRNAGYERYEVSNFSFFNKESKHNLTYWKNEEYFGCGLGASGYVNKIRYKNTQSLNKYLKHEFISETEKIDKNNEKTYFLITNLRLRDGFSLSKYKKLFKSDFYQEHKKEVDSLLNDGLLEITSDGNVKPTDEGIMLLDKILLKFI